MKAEKQVRELTSRIIQPKQEQKQKISIVDNRNIQLSRYTIHKTLPLKTEKKEVDKNQLGRYQKICPSLSATPKENGKFEISVPTLPNTSEKKRRGGGATSVNTVTKNDPFFLAGHLIKAEWGGDDNKINIASWLQSAEDAWSTHFEDIATNILLAAPDSNLVIKVEAEKEDEFITENEIEPFLASKFPNSPTNPENLALALRSIEYPRWVVNAAGETIPYSVKGEIAGRAKLTLDETDTGWNLFHPKAITYLKEATTKKGFLKTNMPPSVNPREVEAKKRSVERKKALTEEYQTLMGVDTSATFKQDIEPDWTPPVIK